ncbi:serine hydrolase [Mycolicibacterium iranicum]|uniref:Serine hydrolase n=1 Tax=Mycolicibacterium iranicum TaxID=912594 RepID=A0A178LNE5_MYCIR|nr:serine hydrolase [Mycolicibacterium iranicum]
MLAASALILGSGACAEPRPVSQPATPAEPPMEQPATDLPENAVRDAVSRIDGIADELMARSGIPGMAVAVVHRGETIYAKGFGVKDNRKPADDPANQVDPDTVFQLASLSKPLGATVVAHQVSRNAISWDTPVIDSLPWFALSDPAVTRMVTVGDMYAHRSGLPELAGDLLEDLGYDRRYILDRLRDYPLDPFRITYHYSNYGLTTGAEAVAAAAGTTWENLSQDVLYGPLGMTSTSSRFADYLQRPNRAVGHIDMDGTYRPDYVRDPDPQSPAGGVSSSVNDLTRWLTMLMGNGTFEGTQIAEPASLLPALTPQSVADRAQDTSARSGFYGYGFDVGVTSDARTSLSHSGAFELGAGTNFVYLPSAEVAIVALTNATPAGVPEALTAQFADLVQFGEVREDWYQLYNAAFTTMEQPVGSLAGKQPPADAAPPAPLASYVGVYDNPFWGPARVTEENGQLQLMLGSQLVVPLRHWAGNTFAVSFVAENSPPGSQSTAVFDGDTLTLEYYDTIGNGAFTR